MWGEVNLTTTLYRLGNLLFHLLPHTYIKMEINKEQQKMKEELKKLKWMKDEFIKETKRMLDLIDVQEWKLIKLSGEIND